MKLPLAAMFVVGLRECGDHGLPFPSSGAVTFTPSEATVQVGGTVPLS